MKAYKSLLRRKLRRADWEIVEILQGGDWWAEEHWRLQSRHEAWGYEVILSFLVDPGWDTLPKTGEGLIWAICATEELPRERPIGRDGEAIAWLSMRKGLFDPKLERFIQLLNARRDEREHLDVKERV